MAKPLTPNYYPSKQKAGDLHDDFRLLFNHMYAARRENADLRRRLEDLQSRHSELQTQVANGPSTTKILGYNVKATQLKDGQVATYVAAEGQIVFK